MKTPLIEKENQPAEIADRIDKAAAQFYKDNPQLTRNIHVVKSIMQLGAMIAMQFCTEEAMKNITGHLDKDLKRLFAVFEKEELKRKRKN